MGVYFSGCGCGDGLLGAAVAPRRRLGLGRKKHFFYSPQPRSDVDTQGEQLLLHRVAGAYFGTLRHGEPHGFGVEVAPDGGIYQGEWNDGFRHGSGRETSADGSVFSGPFVDGLRHGEGLAGPRPQGLPVLREVWNAGHLISSEVAIPEDIPPMVSLPPLQTVAPEVSSVVPSSSSSAPAVREPYRPSGAMAKWSVADVRSWLHSVGLAALAPVFEQAGMDGKQLAALDHWQLESQFRMTAYLQRHRILNLVHRALDHPEECAAGRATSSMAWPTAPTRRQSTGAVVPELAAIWIAEGDLQLAKPPKSAAPAQQTGTSQAILESPEYSPASRPSTRRSYKGGQSAGAESIDVPRIVSEAVVGETAPSNTYLGKAVATRVLRGRPVKRKAADLERAAKDLAALRHPNLALLLGIASRGQSLVVVTECPGLCSTLRGWLERRAPVGDGTSPPPSQEGVAPVLLGLARGVAVGMLYLHSRGVLHLRLRPSCVLIDEETLIVKVTDYATAALEANFEGPKPSRLRNCTPWSPPEVLRDPHYPARASTDIYSFGVILWELLSSRQPFEGLSAAQLVAAVGFARQRLPSPSQCNTLRGPSPEAWVLARACLRHEGDRRPSFQEAVVVLERLEKEYSAKEDALSSFFFGV